MTLYISLVAFMASFILVLACTLQYGDVADKRWRSVMWEPLIAGCSVLGIGAALNGPYPGLAYIVGATAACALAVYLRRSGV